MTGSPLYREAKKWMHFDVAGTYVLRPTGQSAWLHSVVLGDPGNGTITIYNNGAGSGEVVAVMETTANSVTKRAYVFDVRLDTGLTLVVVADSDFLVVYE
jgi:hypothetical protein